MTYWNVGDEEAKEQLFMAAGLEAYGLYHLAGSWCMGEIRLKRDLPVEWFIPAWWVASHANGKRIANKLVSVGLWKQLEGGYGFAWIRDCNTPDAVRRIRKSDRNKPSRRSGREAD